MSKDVIEAELKAAMRGGDALRLSVFRMLSAALHNREIEKRTRSGEARDAPLTDEEVMQVVRAEMKKRRDAIEAYERGSRPEAAAKERAEADILSSLLPRELGDEELAAIAAEGKAALGAAVPQDFGKLVGWVMQRVHGRASGERVSAIVRRTLAPSDT